MSSRSPGKTYEITEIAYTILERERDRERERERERERQTDRQADRQTDRERGGR